MPLPHASADRSINDLLYLVLDSVDNCVGLGLFDGKLNLSYVYIQIH